MTRLNYCANHPGRLLLLGLDSVLFFQLRQLTHLHSCANHADRLQLLGLDSVHLFKKAVLLVLQGKSRKPRGHSGGLCTGRVSVVCQNDLDHCLVKVTTVCLNDMRNNLNVSTVSIEQMNTVQSK